MSNTEDRFLSKEYPSTSGIRSVFKEKKNESTNQRLIYEDSGNI